MPGILQTRWYANPLVYLAGLAVAGLVAGYLLTRDGKPATTYPIDNKPAITAPAPQTPYPTVTPEVPLTPTAEPTKPAETPVQPSLLMYWKSEIGSFGLPKVRVEGDFSDEDRNNNKISDEAEYYGSEVYKRYQELTPPPPTQLRIVIDRSNKSLGKEGVYTIFSNPSLSWPWGAQRYREGSGYTLRHFDNANDIRVGQNSVGHELQHWGIGTDYTTEYWFEEVLPTYYGNLSIFMKEGGKKEDFKFVEWTLKHFPRGDRRLYTPTQDYVQLLLSRPNEPVTVHVPAYSLIGNLELDYNFNNLEFEELNIKLQERINQKGTKLTRSEIRELVESIAGKKVETFDIIAPWMDLHSTDSKKMSSALNRILELYPELDTPAYRRAYLEQFA